jgi:hypothetical protein
MSTSDGAAPVVEEKPTVDPIVADQPAADATETPADAPPAELGGQPVFAGGKIKGPAALETATREINKKLGFDDFPEGPLFGKGAPFKDIVALETHYLKAEQLMGRLSSKEKPAPSKEKLPETPDKLGIEAEAEIEPTAPNAAGKRGYEAVLEKAGLAGKEKELFQKFQKNGKLHDDDYAAFAKAGRDKDEINSFLSGQVAIAAREADRIQTIHTKADTVAGGREQHKVLREWARSNMDPAWLRRWSEISASDPDRYPEMIQLINAEYQKKNGSDRSRPLVNGTPAATPAAGGPITTYAEYKVILDKVTNGTATPAEQRRFAATSPQIAIRG